MTRIERMVNEVRITSYWKIEVLAIAAGLAVLIGVVLNLTS
jgi:hypothetical protein